MLRSLKQEIIERKEEIKTPLKSIYFGGGTPSILNEKELSILLETVYDSFDVEPQVEITLEANSRKHFRGKCKKLEIDWN